MIILPLKFLLYVSRKLGARHVLALIHASALAVGSHEQIRYTSSVTRKFGQSILIYIGTRDGTMDMADSSDGTITYSINGRRYYNIAS